MTAVRTLWGPATIGNVQGNSGALSTVSLNDADNAAGWLFNVPKDGNITDVGVLLVTENGTSPQYNVKLSTVGTDGFPTTTDYGGSTGTPTTWTSAGFKWVTLTVAATAAAGDFAAVHVYPTGSTPTGVNFVSVPSSGVAQGMGISANFTIAWGAANTGSGGFAIRYDDGSVYGIALSSSTGHLVVRSNTTPDEVGDLFTLPANMTCFGARVIHGASALETSATVDVVLYSAADGVLASATISDKDFADNSNYIDVFWDSVNLAANTQYRLIVKPTTGASGGIYVQRWSLDSTAAMAAIPEGTRWQGTSRTDAGAWSNVTTDIVMAALWISDITFIAGSGSGGTEWGFVG
jgi:hypothetical protein